MSKTLTKKVVENVFSADGLGALVNFVAAVKKGENFTLIDYDSKESAIESAKLIVEIIRNIFGKEYDCSVEAVCDDDYKINYRLVA